MLLCNYCYNEFDVSECPECGEDEDFRELSEISEGDLVEIRRSKGRGRTQWDRDKAMM